MALKVENKAGKIELFIFDEIGEWGVRAKDVADAMGDLKPSGDILLHINSPGGSFFDGLAIYNTLKQHRPRLAVSVEGLAASAASIIALAGNRLDMASESWLMIHEAQAVVGGDAAALREMADTVDGFSKSIADIYSQKTKRPHDEMRDAMKVETWLDAQGAVDFGLADGINSDLKVAAYVDPEKFKNCPAQLAAKPDQRRNLKIARAKRMIAAHSSKN